MSRRALWTGVFLGVTGLAVAGELWAALDRSADTVPWTDLLVTYVPEPIVMAGAGLLAAWIVPHFAGHYPREVPVTQPTQTRHPWRATLRTGVAILVGVAPLAPELAAGLHLGTAGVVGQALGVAALITRVMAIPAVNGWLQRYLSPLAAEPAQK